MAAPLQIEAERWRGSLAGCSVTVHQHLDGTLSLTHGPHRLGRYNAQGEPLGDDKMRRQRAVEKTRRLLVVSLKPDISLATKKRTFPLANNINKLIVRQVEAKRSYAPACRRFLVGSSHLGSTHAMLWPQFEMRSQEPSKAGRRGRFGCRSPHS